MKKGTLGLGNLFCIFFLARIIKHPLYQGHFPNFFVAICLGSDKKKVSSRIFCNGKRFTGLTRLLSLPWPLRLCLLDQDGVFPNSNSFGVFSHSKGFGGELLSDSLWFSGVDPSWAGKRFHQGSAKVAPRFHQGFTQVPPGLLLQKR